MMLSNLGVFALATLAPAIQAACTADQLLSVVEVYRAAQISGKLDDLQKHLATGSTYRQNNKNSTLAAGVLGKALALDHNRTTVDTTACASYTELVATGGPYVIGTQIRHTADGASVTAIDSIVATTGDWMFDAKKTLGYIATEDWGTLDAGKRVPRATLQAAADAYLDMWSNSTAINAVPWGSPCARTEGSMHFSPSCKVGVPTSGSASMKIGDRRYVIDETVGSCNVLCAFAGAMPDSHEFRLVNGKLVLVHTITV